MKLHETEAITFDDLEEIWILGDADPIQDEIVLPERGEDNNAEL